MALSTDLSQLKKLQKDLTERDAAEEQITRVKEIISNLQDSCYQDVKLPVKLDTKAAERYEESLKKGKVKKRSAINIVIALITIIAIIATFVSFLFKFDYIGNEYLYTPEIVTQYKGQYYHDTHWDEAKGLQDHVLTISSCSEKGEIEGTFECSLNGEILGSYSFTGKLYGKSADGYIESSIIKKEWIIEPEYEDYLPDEIQSIDIYDNFTSVEAHCGDQPVPLIYSSHSQATDLETPEIIRSYAGTYGTSSYTSDDTIGSTTITSCDANGHVSGYFEFYDYYGNYGKYALDGQIIKKYNDVVHITLNAGEWIEKADYYSPLEEMNVIIYDQYTSFSCSQYWMKWTDSTTPDGLKALLESEEGSTLDINTLKEMLKSESVADAETEPELLTRRPLSEKETLERNIMLGSLLAILVFGVIVASLLKKVSGLNSLTKKEEEKLKELQAKDKAAKTENEHKYSKIIQDRKKAANADIKMWRDEITAQKKNLDELEMEISANTVIAAKDKNLDTVNYIIDLIESRRADSVKEALREYDKYKAERSAREGELIRQHTAALDAKYKAMEDYENYINQRIHNAKLEREAERQTDELKRIRKELEDHR